MTYNECKTICDEMLSDLSKDFHTEGHHKDMQDSLVESFNAIANLNERVNTLETA